MTSTEEPSGTVLHRLIQEQLRYGNPTDTRTLLAIQQQALRGGSGSNSGPSSGGDMGRSPRSSLESLTQEELPFPQLSARQEPQGQEHQGDYHHSESGYDLYQLHGEELPTYEQAKAHSQYLASHWAHAGPIRQLQEGTLLHEGAFHEEPDLMELKCSHARSLSEHHMQISLERNDAAAKAEAIKSNSHSYPELPYNTYRNMVQSLDKRSPPPEYSAPIQGQGFIPHQVQESVQAQQHRYVQSSQSTDVPCYNAFNSLPPAGLEEPSQVELLMMENERLRQELAAHREKTNRIQKLEQEIQRISEAYETLMQGSTKRESLEQTLRRRLVSEIRRLQDFNRDLRENLENARTHVAKEVEAADHNQHIMAKLLEQNEEQNLERERSERELQRLRSTCGGAGCPDEAPRGGPGGGAQAVTPTRGRVEKKERLCGEGGEAPECLGPAPVHLREEGEPGNEAEEPT
ncbi:hypothetical protein fugu_013950 [Takifugu bimaculatus]|uniref:Angiomotin C-terminal domain-containing protein n=1 Tax=Takifugu bimaculatus TaxID=433685 RepID=A0A4Z2C005_9TELE|nr:hypothetical protein fugu_013950 [Takifugu bimaculatus]